MYILLGEYPFLSIAYPFQGENHCGNEFGSDPLKNPSIPYLYKSTIEQNIDMEAFVTLPFWEGGISLLSICSPIFDTDPNNNDKIRRGVICLDGPIHNGALTAGLMKKIPSLNGAYIVVDEEGTVDDATDKGAEIICDGKELNECPSLLAMDNGFQVVFTHIKSGLTEYTYLNNGILFLMISED